MTKNSSSSSATASRSYPFEFTGLARMLDRTFGVHAAEAAVQLSDSDITVDFGPWRISSPLTNVASMGLTSPCSVATTIGPPRFRGSPRAFGVITSTIPAVELRFSEPIAGAEPTGRIRMHRLAVTVTEHHRLIEELAARGVTRHDVEDRRAEQAAVDRLEGMTATELRAVARDEGIASASHMKKAELIEVIEGHHDAADLVELVEDAAT